MRRPQSSPNPSYEWRKIPFSIEGILCSEALPFAGPTEPVFSFSAFPFARLLYLSPPAGRGWFSRHCPWIRPQLAHTVSTGWVTLFAGVVSLPHPLTGHKSPHRAESVFSLPRTSSPLPPKGEGLGFAQFGVVRVRNAEKPGAFSQEKTDVSCPRGSLSSCSWHLLLTTAPHGFNGAGNPFCWCCFPTLAPKSHTGAHRAEFGVYFFFRVCFRSGRVAKSRSSL